MPTPARTSLDEIVAAGQALLEADGLGGLTMQRVATAVGIRAPSLYKRVRDRGDLVRLIVDRSFRELTDRLDSVVGSGDPRRDLAALAYAFREFARSRPETYGLLFARLPESSRVAFEVEFVVGVGGARGRSDAGRAPRPTAEMPHPRGIPVPA